MSVHQSALQSLHREWEDGGVLGKGPGRDRRRPGRNRRVSGVKLGSRLWSMLGGGWTLMSRSKVPEGFRSGGRTC